MATEEKENEIRVGHQIQRSLMDHLALQRAVLDGASYMIIATDVDGVIFSFNRAAERKLLYDAADVIGKMTPAAFHDPEEVAVRALALSIETGRSFEPGFEVFIHNARSAEVDEREWTYIRKDGTSFPVNLTVTALRDEKGEIIGFLGIADDITEKKRAIDEIRAVEERFESFMNHSPVLAYLKDRNGRYIFINQTMERVFGISVEKLTGKTDFDWLPEDVARSVTEKDKLILAGGEPIEYTSVVKSVDGVNRTWQTYKFSIYDGVGNPFVGVVAFDITKQQETEVALRKSEQRSRDLIDKSPGLISTHTLDGTLLSVNPAAAHSLGYEPDELVGRSLREFLPPDRQALFGEFIKQVKAHRGLSGEMRVINKQGDERTWSYTNTIYEDDGVPYVLGHAFDITENKVVEVALRESEERMRLFVEHTPAAVAMLDRDMRYVMTSKRWLTDYNLGEQDIVGRSHYEVFPDIPPHWKDLHQRGIKGEVLKCDEDPFPRADGSLEWLHWEMYPWRDNQGEIGGIIFFTEVITGRKRMEEALLLSAAIVESSDDAIMSKTLEGIVKSWNRGAEKIFGYTADEIIGKHVSMLFPDDRITEEEDILNSIKSGKNIEQFQTIRVKKSGEHFPVSITISPVIDEKGNIIGVSKITRDITGQKKAEAQLEIARDAALESAKMKSEFLANMSHEIRTPMNGVIGMTDMLLTTALSKEQRELAEIIKSSADGLLTIINDILDFSKIEAGKLQFETLDFDLRDTVENSIEIFADDSQRKHIELASLIESDINTNLRGDPGRLRQVLTNLIGNAVKFTESGEVVLRIEKESETKRSCRLRFSISDTGIGIEPNVQQNLFQPFTQADGTMSRKYGGTGLGLAISKQLVELMNGEIRIRSTPGQGSVFSFTAEFEKQERTPEQKKIPLSNLQKIRVLIVDDNKTNRRILMHQVTSWGMLADEAADGPSAIVKLRAAVEGGDPYQLAILDLMMPGLNGFELAYFIKSDFLISDIKLILMPSFGQRGHTQSAKETGIDGYLIKPVRQSDLFDCIANVMAAGDTSSEFAIHRTIRPAAPADFEAESADTDIPDDELILVAEDNPVNQKVVRMQLEQLGYRSDVVSNGLEALSALKERLYSLILMDCQMPQMDGYTASREIRRIEDGKGRIPIVAITANAMEGEREKCLEAGMDEYITKPVNIQTLSKTISYWIRMRKKQRDTDLSMPTFVTEAVDPFVIDDAVTLDDTVLDGYRGLQQPGGADLVTELIDLFISDADRRLKLLKAAQDSGDTTRIKEIAHTFRGSAGNVGALKLATYGKLIEDHIDDPARTGELVADMSTELKLVISQLKKKRTGK